MKKQTIYSVIFLLVVIIAIALAFRIRVLTNPILSPMAPEQGGPVIVRKIYAKEDTIDTYVDEAASKFGSYSKMKMTLHCLLYYESKHGLSKGFGDNGKAGGIMQFWEGTWTNMRKKMIKQGLVTELSTRMNEKDAILTTAWAITQGR